MQRVRVLVPAVVLTVFGGFLLTACRSEPTAAAYVGDDKISDAYVTELIADFSKRTKPSPAPGVAEPEGQALPRNVVVSTLVINRLCAKLKEEKNFTTKPTTPQDVAGDSGISPDTLYIKEYAEMLTCLSGLEVAGDKPTEAQLRELYDTAAANGLVDPATQPFDAVKDSLAADPTIQEKSAAQRALSEGAKIAAVTVNPRYRPLAYQVFLQQGVYFAVPLGEPGLNAVTPAPATAANPDVSDGPMAPPQ